MPSYDSECHLCDVCLEKLEVHHHWVYFMSFSSFVCFRYFVISTSRFIPRLRMFSNIHEQPDSYLSLNHHHQALHAQHSNQKPQKLPSERLCLIMLFSSPKKQRSYTYVQRRNPPYPIIKPTLRFVSSRPQAKKGGGG